MTLDRSGRPIDDFSGSFAIGPLTLRWFTLRGVMESMVTVGLRWLTFLVLWNLS